MKAKYLFIIAALVAGSALADEASKQKKVSELMAVIGIEKSMIFSVGTCKETMTQIMKRAKRPDNADPELLQRLDEISTATAVACDDAFDLNESKINFAKHLGAGMSEQDLSETLKFLKSAVGQRYLWSQSNATVQFSADVDARMVQVVSSMKIKLTKQIQEEMAKFRARSGLESKQIVPSSLGDSAPDEKKSQ